MSNELKAAVDAAIAAGQSPKEIVRELMIRAAWSRTAKEVADEVAVYLKVKKDN